MGVVLVVDDEPGIAELIRDVLADEGHQVLTAANGSRGLEALGREAADLVFLDYMMPVLDGAGMLRGMAERPQLLAIPVVMMSSMPEPVIRDRCRGHVAFLRKPFRIAEIVAMTERLIGRQAPPEA